MKNSIGLITVFDAILTSRQTGLKYIKIQCREPHLLRHGTQTCEIQ